MGYVQSGGEGLDGRADGASFPERGSARRAVALVAAFIAEHDRQIDPATVRRVWPSTWLEFDTRILARMAYVVAVVAGLLFGAVDQFLGTLHFGPWGWTVSGMSAPWLILPFLAGMTQERRRRAIALGLVVTMAALAGYFAMSNSPMEGAPLDRFWGRIATMISTGYNPLWILAGVLTGPLYGFLGHRWRVARSWISAVLVTSALCLEPLARKLAGMLSGPPLVWGAEVAVGTVVAVLFIFMIASARRGPETVPPTG